MTKKIFIGMLIIAAVTTNAFTGEWDYVPNVRTQYMMKMPEQVFRELGNEDQNAVFRKWGSPHRVHQITKLPREVTQAMHKALESYNLEVGDVFWFGCGYDDRTPRTIAVFLRITQVNRDGTYSYNFYAWQVIGP